jgi:hypothetical protein
MARIVWPTREEFTVEGDEVTHVPTGAVWWAYEGRPEPWGRRDAMLGSVLENGDDYRPHEVDEMAR